VEEAGGKVGWLNFDPSSWRLDLVASVPQFFDEIKAEVERALSKT
jgi:hypothetical protein